MMPIPKDDPQLAILSTLQTAIWISDVDEVKIIWANPSAVQLWLAESLEELLNRDTSNTSETARQTLQNLRHRLLSGEKITSQRTIYPKGIPVLIEMKFGTYTLPDGRVALLVEGRQLEQDVIGPTVLRNAEAARYAPICISTHTLDGALLTSNTTAQKCLGETFHFRDIFTEEHIYSEALDTVQSGKTYTKEIEILSKSSRYWVSLSVHPIPDPVTGKGAFIVSLVDISDRVKTEKLKDEFISIISHELRTPLTSIQGALSLLENLKFGTIPKEVKALIGLASRNSRRLHGLVDDLLNLKQWLHEGILFEKRPCTLSDILKHALELNKPLLASHHTEVQMPTDDHEEEYFVDASRLIQAISNVLSNAAKFTPKGGKLQLSLHYTPEGARLSIKDNGPGIPESFRERIFQKFERADSQSTRKHQGTGLGLYITKTIIEHHGGSIDYSSSEKGTEFIFHIPK